MEFFSIRKDLEDNKLSKDVSNLNIGEIHNRLSVVETNMNKLNRQKDIIIQGISMLNNGPHRDLYFKLAKCLFEEDYIEAEKIKKKF